MLFELPKVRIDSVKDFAKHYLMIVLSILTALGLEAWIEHAHHTHAAEFASQQIETELRANLADVRAAHQENLERVKPLQQLEALVTRDIKAGLPATTINQHIREHKSDFKISMGWPTFGSQAWDVAVANQSASWIKVDALRKYSSAYANQRDAATWMMQDSTIGFNASRMMDLKTHLELGVDADPLEFLETLHQMTGMVAETQSHLEQLETQLAATLSAGNRDAGKPGADAH